MPPYVGPGAPIDALGRSNVGRQIGHLDSSPAPSLYLKLGEKQKTTGVQMAHYRCYFLADGHIEAAQDIDEPNDGSAFLKAEAMATTSRFPIIEIWQEDRLVGRAQRNPAFRAGRYKT